jgi:SAM-dependent methyltransferase
VERILSRLPPAGRVLDAACGTGKYFPMVLASGRSLFGVDNAGAYLAIAAAKFPQIPTERHDLQELPYRGKFDGVLCVDAMEFVPPEDWPLVLERFHGALRSGGWLYLTVELAPADRVRAANQAARRSGLPVVDGEVIWDEPDGYYHHYPSIQQVRHGSPMPASPSRRRPRGPGTMRGTPTTTCWPAWRPRQGEDARSAIVIGGSTWLGRGCLQRITSPSTVASDLRRRRVAQR